MSAESSRGGSRAATTALAYLALVALTLSPLLWASVPPLTDYPNHLARMWILLQDGAIPELARNYVVHWQLLPNLAMDLIVPALAQVMPLELAGRLFIALTMLSLIVGTATLYRVLHGRFGVWSACALLFVYNAALFWGFLNFLFGAGLFLLVFSAWIATGRWPIGWRLLAFSPVATALLALHLFAFGVYALAVAGYEIGERLRKRELSAKSFASLCLAGLQFVPAALLWLMGAAHEGPTLTTYGTPPEKAIAALSGMTFERAPQALDIVLILTCAVFAALAVRGRWVKLAPQMRLPLALLAGVAVLIPTWLNGIWAADIRLPIILMFLIVASTRLERPPRGRLVPAFAALAVLLLCVRIGVVTGVWREYDAQLQDLRAASAVIDPGARLLVVWDQLEEDDKRVDGVPRILARRLPQSYWHAASLAVIDRSAFIPSLFTLWTPVEVTERNDGLFRVIALPLGPDALAAGATAETTDPDSSPNPLGEGAYWHRWPETFDYVLWFDFAKRPLAGLPQLELAAEGSFFRIYRIVRPSGSAAAEARAPAPD